MEWCLKCSICAMFLSSSLTVSIHPIAQEALIEDCNQLALHVALQFCYQLDAVHEKPGEDALAGVPFVTYQIAKDPLDERFVPERLLSSTLPGVSMKFRRAPSRRRPDVA